MTFQRATGSETQNVHSHFGVPPPCSSFQSATDPRLDAAAVRGADCSWWLCRVEIHRNVQLLDGRPQWFVLGFIEKVAVALSPEHRAQESEFQYTAVQFGNASLDVGQRQRSEGAETLWFANHDSGQLVVCGARQLRGEGRLRLLDLMGGNRQHLNVDARRVHPREALLAHFGKLVRETRKQVPPITDPRMQVMWQDMLFKSDERHLVAFQTSSV
jgi:hypothetical protein